VCSNGVGRLGKQKLQILVDSNLTLSWHHNLSDADDKTASKASDQCTVAAVSDNYES